MRRANEGTATGEPEVSEPDPAEARTLDLSEVSVYQLRDRLAAHRDGREEKVIAAAAELRMSLDRFAAGIAARREALVTRAGELARAAAPLAGGIAAAGVGVVLVARRSRRSQRADSCCPRTG